ncbi:RCC1 domain-containing protein 1 [Trichonephila inaurata madagascariensis]|uniref:RCC1 domain-containing protein 1 n=1 Tax=Trichonephila inaurata madagascariensis TaxID=2747483 RepID=A0A8X6YID8_9ARAC|nr:RCC1 domain-containing protein 1 [Trichonephila inaurata madagascariensis]
MDKVYIYFGLGESVKLNDHDFQILDLLFSKTNFYSNPKVENVCLGLFNVLFRTETSVYSTWLLKLKGKCLKVKAIPRDVENISCGMLHSYLISKCGKCYVLSNRDFSFTILNTLSDRNRIKSIVTEDLQNIALTEDGKVFNIEINERAFLKPLMMPMPIKEVACGKEHVLLLSNVGTILSYGSGSRGQLGHGCIKNQENPTLIEALEGLEIKAISAGGWHSAAISSCGDLYMWGWNESGQLGLPCNELQHDKRPLEEIETICCLPKIIELDNEIPKEVGCGSRHTAVLTENNHLWTWGWNDYGQLGHKKYRLTDKPEQIPLPDSFDPVKLQAKYWSTLITGRKKECPKM